jgi:hypothetical protein
MPKRAAFKLFNRARDFDRQTKESGKHGGAIGHTPLKVLHTIIFDFMNFKTGRLDPSIKAIADKANVCPRVVASAIGRLRDLGILDWVRRCDEGWTDGRYWRRQLTNAYCLFQVGWKGYTPPSEPPAPRKGTWGEPARMPNVIDAAIAAGREHGAKAQVQALRLGLYGVPNDDTARLNAALASLGTRIADSGKK